jgi:hypothetical protein
MMGQRCVVIMPHGEREVEFLKESSKGVAIKVKGPLDFNRVYKEIVEPAIKAADFEVASGPQNNTLVTQGILNNLLLSDVAIADITLPDLSVSDEFRVSHALRRSRTILIRHADVDRISSKPNLHIKSDDSAHLRHIDYRLDRSSVRRSSSELTDMLRAMSQGNISKAKRRAKPITHGGIVRNLVHKREEVMLHAFALILAIEEALNYDPQRYHNIPPPELRILEEGDPYIRLLEGIKNELIKLNANLTALNRENDAVENAVRLRKYGDEMVSEFSKAIGKGAGFLLLAALAALLANAGLGSDFISNLLTRNK